MGRTQNEDAVITVETSDIPEAKNSTAGLQQFQGLVGCFLWFMWSGASLVCIIRLNHHKRVLSGGLLQPSWCCVMQRTRSVGRKILAARSQQCTRTFCACNSGFLSRTQHSSSLSGSILTLRGSVCLLAISQTENDTKRDQIWVKRGHHAECDEPAEHHYKNWVPGVFPKISPFTFSLEQNPF